MLRAIRGVFDGDMMHVAGHDNSVNMYTRFTAGGGSFIWDATSTVPDDGGCTISPTGTGRWKRMITWFVTPEMFGAVGDANWMDETTGIWYQDQALTIPATDDSAAIQAALNFAGISRYKCSAVLLSKWYLIGATLVKPDAVSIIGTGQVQTGSRTGSALCASHDAQYVSIRQSSNAWTNSVLFINNRVSLTGGGVLRDFSVLGCSTTFGSANALTSWADRCGIQYHFGLNCPIFGVTIQGFKKAGLSFVASQDIPVTALWLCYCGTDDGTNWYPSLEFLRDPTDDGGNGLIAGTNAIHFHGLRHEACFAYMNFDNSTTNLGEIHFVASKIESPPGWLFNTTPFRVVSGFGPISFGSGVNINFPTCMTSTNVQVWVFDIRNFSTKFVGCKWFGGSQGDIMNGGSNRPGEIKVEDTAVMYVWNPEIDPNSRGYAPFRVEGSGQMFITGTQLGPMDAYIAPGATLSYIN